MHYAQNQSINKLEQIKQIFITLIQKEILKYNMKQESWLNKSNKHALKVT